jgi:hypothetical protein
MLARISTKEKEKSQESGMDEKGNATRYQIAFTWVNTAR